MTTIAKDIYPKVALSQAMLPFRLESVSCSVMSDSWRPHGLQLARLLCPWNSPGKNTGVSSYSLLQGIFLTQGLNPGLPHCMQILYSLSHQGSPKNTGIGRHSLLQGIFPTKRWNPGLPHRKQILGDSNGKESACSAGDQGSIPGLGRSPGEGNGYPFQFSCLENSLDREAWRVIVHGVAKSWTQLND